MTQAKSLLLALLLFTFSSRLHARAQTDQLLPEIDVYYKMKSDVRIWFQAKETREGGNPVSAEIGPSLDLYSKPWLRLNHVTAFDSDDSKKRLNVLSIGYRILTSPNADVENRLEPVVTLNLPAKDKLLFSDRNRADLDWKSGRFSWRYRNRVSVERALQIRSYHPTAFASAETFYDSQYGKLSDTAIYIGCLFPIGKHFEFSPYYEHQNNTGKKPNQQLNQLGLVLKGYF